VLVADDEPIVANLYTRLADISGYRTLPPVNSLAALKSSLAQEPVRLLLLDVRMQGANSLNHLGALRRRYSSLRTIVMTGYETLTVARQALSLSCEGILWKSLSTNEEVTRALHEVQSGNEYLSSAIRPHVPYEYCTPARPLSSQQCELFCLLWRGKTQNEIARLLGTAPRNIEARVATLRENLGLRNRKEHVRWRLIIVRPPPRQGEVALSNCWRFNGLAFRMWILANPC
jgi:DNA-binding NarL/FixJ family response regulator